MKVLIDENYKIEEGLFIPPEKKKKNKKRVKGRNDDLKPLLYISCSAMVLVVILGFVSGELIIIPFFGFLFMLILFGLSCIVEERKKLDEEELYFVREVDRGRDD